jgi:hypothetical protein
LESGHYFREKGAKAEKIIHDLSIKTFFTDWCYQNPPRPGGKELCDLLVVFDDTAIIWQIKDLKVDENGRYKQAEVEKNLRQLSGARRTLFDIKAPVKLSNPRRGEELFDPSKIKNVHLITIGNFHLQFITLHRAFVQKILTDCALLTRRHIAELLG